MLNRLSDLSRFQHLLLGPDFRAEVAKGSDKAEKKNGL